MATEYLIGVDLGTSVVKTTLFDLAGRRPGRCHARKQCSTSPPRASPSRTALTSTMPPWTPSARWWTKATSGPDPLLPSPSTAKWPAQWALIETGTRLTPWYPSSLDIRYQPYLAQMQARAGERLVRLNGALPFMAPRMLRRQAEQPALFAQIYKVVTLANYVAGRLAGLTGDDAFVDLVLPGVDWPVRYSRSCLVHRVGRAFWTASEQAAAYRAFYHGHWSSEPGCSRPMRLDSGRPTGCWHR